MTSCHARLAALVALLVPSAGFAADPQALSTNVPVPTQDALVVDLGVLELQGTGVYTNDRYNSKGRDLLELSPTLKIGAAKHLQLDFSAPYGVGNQSTASLGTGSADFIYEFNDPTPSFPALAVQGGSQFFEYGEGHRSNQYFLRGLATQWLGDSSKAPRLDLNFNWTHVTEAIATSRREQMELGVAYSMLITTDTALVADVVHGAKSAKDQNETVVDVGLRHLLTDTVALSGAVGAGIGQQSPAFRILFAIQKDFKLF